MSDHIGVPLHAGHEGGLANGGAQIALAAALGDRVFAHIDLRARRGRRNRTGRPVG